MSLTRTVLRLVSHLKPTNQVRYLSHMTRSIVAMEKYRLPLRCTCQTAWNNDQVRSYAKGRDKVKHHGKKGMPTQK